MVDRLNNTVYCTLAPSPIHGIGVFAIRHIPKGTLYTDHTNDTLDQVETYELTPEKFDTIDPAIQALILDRTVFEGDTLRFTSPNTDAVLRSFMNHSSTPNTDGKRTLRDIMPGEELTEDFFSLTKDIHPLSSNHFKHLK